MNERHTCTEEDPYNPEIHDRGIHPDAYEVGEQEEGWPGGDMVSYYCPICKTKWRTELPQ